MRLTYACSQCVYLELEVVTMAVHSYSVSMNGPYAGVSESS